MRLLKRSARNVKELPSIEVLSSIFICDSVNGILYSKRSGLRIGSLDAYGYRQVYMLGGVWKEHRIIWKMHFNLEPPIDLDHRNNIFNDNRIENLRIASVGQNIANAKKYSNNASGIKGVSFSKELGKWKAYIRTNFELEHLGYFDTLEEAAKVRRARAFSLRSEFARED